MTFHKLRKGTLLLALLFAVHLLAGCAKKQEPVEENKDSGFHVGYAVEGITAVEDPDAMTKAIDEAYEKAEEGRMALEYKNDAVSDNGTDFSCYIANSVDNQYDMFIAIYADIGFTDELYLSQLIRPGTAFEQVTLNRALDPGKHEVYVAFTTVETTEDEQIIHGQSLVTMNFIVNS